MPFDECFISCMCSVTYDKVIKEFGIKSLGNVDTRGQYLGETSMKI